MPYRPRCGVDEITTTIITPAAEHRHTLRPVSRHIGGSKYTEQHGHFAGFVFLPRESDAVPTHGFYHPVPAVKSVIISSTVSEQSKPKKAD